MRYFIAACTLAVLASCKAVPVTPEVITPAPVAVPADVIQSDVVKQAPMAILDPDVVQESVAVAPVVPVSPTPELVVPVVPNSKVQVPSTMEEVFGFFPSIHEAFDSKSWSVFFGLILAILIFFLRFFFVYIPKRFVIPVTAAVSLAWYIVASWSAGTKWTTILSSTVVTTAAAVLIYEVMKPLLRKWGLVKDEVITVTTTPTASSTVTTTPVEPPK